MAWRKPVDKALWKSLEKFVDKKTWRITGDQKFVEKAVDRRCPFAGMNSLEKKNSVEKYSIRGLRETWEKT
jgi:hypothetical protein